MQKPDYVESMLPTRVRKQPWLWGLSLFALGSLYKGTYLFVLLPVLGASVLQIPAVMLLVLALLTDFAGEMLLLACVTRWIARRLKPAQNVSTTSSPVQVEPQRG